MGTFLLSDTSGLGPIKPLKGPSLKLQPELMPKVTPTPVSNLNMSFLHFTLLPASASIPSEALASTFNPPSENLLSPSKVMKTVSPILVLTPPLSGPSFASNSSLAPMPTLTVDCFVFKFFS
ncbi:MAG: hypothetical protein H0W75_02350 [Chitinophagaceae bacterium]|nr:hypothetical protein [Chitinophagaceae bacterium]